MQQGEHAADRFGFVDFHDTRIEPRFNVAPTQSILTIVMENGRRVPRPMRWGFQPDWMRQRGAVPPPINAKAETLVEKGMWRTALQRGRCLIPADGFFEWRSVPGRNGKQPMYVRLHGGPLFAFAGLYTPSDERGPSCAIVTTSANELMASIHPRMPVILAREAEDQWLDPEVSDPVALLACLQAYPADAMEVVPVGPQVGNVRNEGPALLEPAEDVEAPGQGRLLL